MRRALKIIAATLASCFVFSFAACGTEEKPRTSYEITASYDESSRVLTADMTVNYVNGTDSVLDEVCFHLYPVGVPRRRKVFARSRNVVAFGVLRGRELRRNRNFRGLGERR